MIRGCKAIENDLLGGRGPSARPRSSCSTLGAKALVASAGFAMQHGCLATSYYRRLDAKSRPRAGSNGADSRATFEFAQPRLEAAVEEAAWRISQSSKIRVSFEDTCIFLDTGFDESPHVTRAVTRLAPPSLLTLNLQQRRSLSFRSRESIM